MWQFPIARLLTASVIAGIIGVSGALLTANVIQPDVAAYLEPARGTILIGEQFTVSLMIDSKIPTNVYKGVLNFDPEKLTVERIDYNTSVANLWAEEPWYSNGDGTINFIGGTTNASGFTGRGSLITVTFKSKALGEAKINLNEMIILKHDGLGTTIPVTGPIDALFSVNPEALKEQALLSDDIKGPDIHIVRAIPNTDLNNDGSKDMTDISIFMSDFITQNLRSDFSGDGQVDLEDVAFLPIL